MNENITIYDKLTLARERVCIFYQIKIFTLTHIHTYIYV